MELASLYNSRRKGGVFFADVNSDLAFGIAPLQFNLSAHEVVAFWTANIDAWSEVRVPTLAIGVHAHGDWHKAVDYYVGADSVRTRFPNTPAWLREAGGIYSFSAGGAGAIYLAPAGLPAIQLGDGAVGRTWERKNGPWTDGAEERVPDSFPVQISTCGFAPAGSPLLAVAQSSGQVNVIAASWDGALWTTWQSGGGAWKDGRDGRVPERISPLGMAPPGAMLSSALQTSTQLDVFWAGKDGALWVTWAVGNSAWRDGVNGRQPARITPLGVAVPGCGTGAARQRPDMLDVFWVRHDGAIWVTWVIDTGAWRDGGGGRDPLRVTPVGLAPPGAPLAAIDPNPQHVDVFVVGRDGALYVTWEENNGPWRDGDAGRLPIRITQAQFFPPGAHVIATQQNDHQFVVCAIGTDGAVWAILHGNNDAWQPAVEGRTLLRLTPPGIATPGAPLAAAHQSPRQLNVFFVGPHGAITATFETNDGPWSDGIHGRPAPVAVSPPGFAPAGGGVATMRRSDEQMEAYAVTAGLIRSFRELPKLLAEAAGLGTSVVYLWDYWEGSDRGGWPPYWNKGDYIPRGDLGGEDALKDGIASVQRSGGRVLVYVEPFILYEHSLKAHDPGWRWGLNYDGTEFASGYAGYHAMPAFLGEWQDHVVAVARRLVGEYGVDGIFLDSWAWQMNLRMRTQGDPHFYSQREWSQAALSLTRRVRDAVREIRSDAVVIGETTAGPIARTWDGGLAVDFWPDKVLDVTPEREEKLLGPWRSVRAMNDGRLVAAPARYAFPQLNYFSNGLNLCELHQVFAAGYSLALWSNRPGGGNNYLHDNAKHICELLKIRRKYKGALIYGRQEYQPATSDPAVVAYFYRGGSRLVITIVNTDATRGRAVRLELAETERRTWWSDSVGRGVFTADRAGLLDLDIGAGDTTAGIRVLVRVSPFTISRTGEAHVAKRNTRGKRAQRRRGSA
jgi:hypothetical protein